jgi:hypothetical protein
VYKVVPRQKDNDIPVVESPGIFVVISVVECLGGREEMVLARRNEEMCMQSNIDVEFWLMFYDRILNILVYLRICTHVADF